MSRDSHQPVGRRRQRRPFDLAADDAEDLTQEFWGRSRAWADHTPADGHALQHAQLGGSYGETDHAGEPDVFPDDERWAQRTGAVDAMRAVFNTRRNDQVRRMRRPGGIDRTRTHGIVRPDAVRPEESSPEELAPTGPTSRVRLATGEASLGELASGHASAGVDWDDDDWDLIPANTRRHAVVPSVGRAAIDREPTGRRSVVTERAHRSPDVELDLDDVGPARRADRVAGRRGGVAPLGERLGFGAVDPLLLRLGVLVLTGALAVPVALGMRDGDSGALVSADGAAGAVQFGAPLPTDQTGTPASVAPVAPTAAAVATAEVATAAVVDAPSANEQASTAGSRQGSDVVVDSGPPSTEVSTTTATEVAGAAELSGAASVTQSAERVEPACALEYEAAAGDSWYRIADGAGIAVDELLATNLAGLDTPIFPGDEICLPDGASMPTPPTSTTAAPTTTAAPVASTTTTTTTVAPTTTAAPSTPIATRDEVQALIREIWPDELEEKALAIAKRESNYHADAYNGWCCYGVFQLYYTVHQSWLDDFGINRASDLYDARKNITAAYALYERSGGWGPWGG